MPSSKYAHRRFYLHPRRRPFSRIRRVFLLPYSHRHRQDRRQPNENEPKLSDLTFTELRDKLLSLDPLNKDHVTKINEAESKFWKRSEGYRAGWSDEILGFDCCGQQWVSETCFPAGTLSKPNMKDLKFIEEVVGLIEKEDIHAPSSIEKRWSASSKSLMSHASSESNDDILSWVLSGSILELHKAIKDLMMQNIYIICRRLKII